VNAPESLPRTIAGAVDHEIVIRKSRFLAHLEPVATIAEADAVIASVRKRHWDARHHCVALVVGPHGESQRSSDDGEPSGTAGVPMLTVLRRRNVSDVVAVVTRYFGGVLLGAGGLVRAYSSSVGEALDRAVIVRRAEMVEVALDVPHADAGRVDHALREWAGANGAVVEEPSYADAARFTLLVPPDSFAQFVDVLAATSPGLTPVAGARRIVDMPAGQ